MTFINRNISFWQILSQDENYGVEFEYSISSSSFQDSKVQGEKYVWMAGSWTECSEACGGGSRTRNVDCRASSTKEITSELLCTAEEKPLSQEECNIDECKVSLIGLNNMPNFQL